MQASSNQSISDKKKEIIIQLKKDILFLNGFKNPSANYAPWPGLGPIEDAFPNGCFPLAATHEFLTASPESNAATSGFIACLMATLMHKGGASVWISSSRTLFPPALKPFGLDPGNMVFIDLQKNNDALWVMEEALKCNGIAAVIAEVPELSFTVSRRLQLAVEQSQVTGFIIRKNTRNLNVNACISRWKITPLPSQLEDNMQGIGFPRWNVELLKIRNGKPEVWQMEWSSGRFCHIPFLVTSTPQEQRKKTG